MVSITELKTHVVKFEMDVGTFARYGSVRCVCYVKGDFTVCSCAKSPDNGMSSETSFISKQPKLEPKLVSALYETRRLLRLFCFNIETGSFRVLKQVKQTKDQPKQQQIC